MPRFLSSCLLSRRTGPNSRLTVLGSAMHALWAAALLANGTAFAEEQAAELAPVVVTASPTEQVDGPVRGYVAKRSATGTKTDTPLAETPQSISVITPERMRDQGAQSVQDALRYSAGVRGETYGLDSRGDWSTVRGTDPVIFLDGMQQTFGYYASSRPDPFTLERIEILKGPASVLYGQGTVGGLINLTSKRPQSKPNNELQLQYGSFDRKQIAADVGGALTADKSLIYRVVALARDSNTQVNHVADDRQILMPSISWRPNETIEWTLLAGFQKDKTGSTAQFLPHAGTVLPGPNGLPRIPTDIFISEPGFDEYTTEQRSLSSLFTWRPNDRWTVRQNLRYAQSEVDYKTIYPAFPPVLQENGDIERVFWVARPELRYLTLDNQVQAEFGSGKLKHTVLAGLDYQHAVTTRSWAYGSAGTLNVYNPVYGNFTPPAAADFNEDPKNTIDQLGLYLQDQISWNDRWLSTVGVRLDRANNHTAAMGAAAGSEQSDTAASKRLALMYKSDIGLNPYVSYSESFMPVIGVNASGATFRPLRGTQFEVGVKFQPARNNSFITASIYDLREKNRKTPDPANPMNELQLGEAQTQGLELEAAVEINNSWNILANYSYTDTESEGKNLASVPDHMLSLWSQHQFAVAAYSGFKAGIGARYVGVSQDGADTLETPAYTLFDAMIGYDAKDWSVALNANNLEDEIYYTTCLARGDCFTGTRRTLVATVSYRF